jgi:hypothetical protein
MRTTKRKPAPLPLTEIIGQAVCTLATDPHLPPDLPTIYRLAWERCPALMLGTFHDTLRQLHDGGRVRLQPFTRALATLPDRCNALLLDGEVMYFAEPIRRPAA